MEEKYATYKEVLLKDLQRNYIFFGVFCVLIVIGIIIFAFWGKLNIKEYKKTSTKKNRKRKSGKIELVMYWSVLMLFCLTIVIGIPSQVLQISKLRSDINNESFVVYNSEFTIYSKLQWLQRGPTYTEYFIRIDYETYTIELELPVGMKNENSLSEGEYSDMVIVYGEKSKKIVDIYKV